MKTIIARFTELKNNVSATESEFEDLDYNKVDTALKSVGVALKDSMG
jgi:flagellin-like hook-associated protein FlgL